MRETFFGFDVIKRVAETQILLRATQASCTLILYCRIWDCLWSHMLWTYKRSIRIHTCSLESWGTRWGGRLREHTTKFLLEIDSMRLPSGTLLIFIECLASFLRALPYLSGP